MFKKIINFFRKKVKEERAHKEESALRDKVNAHIHRMFYSINNHHSFIGISVTGEGGEKIEGIVCYVKEYSTIVDVMTERGDVWHIDLLKYEYAVHWHYERSHVHYTKENWEQYQLLCTRIMELDEDSTKSLFKLDGAASEAKLFFWSDSYSKLMTGPRPVKNVYMFGYNAHTVKTLDELKAHYADLKRKSFGPVKEWYNSNQLSYAERPNASVMKGDLARHNDAKTSDVSLLAVVEAFDKIQVSGGIVYDRIALNLHTNSFELIMAYHYTRIGRIDELGQS